MLIDAFVNAIYLYDDKLVITFNYKDGTRTITLDDVKEAVKNNTGSDLDCRGAPSPFAVIDTMAAKGDSYFNVYFLITPCFPNFLPIFLPLIGI